MIIRDFCKADFAAVSAIYQMGIDTGHATFQLLAKSWDEWHSSLLPHSRLVAELDGKVVGWAALSPISSRAVYAGVAEVSVYVDTGLGGRGIGQALLSHLVNASEQRGIWTLQAVIFPENLASIALHQKNGFNIVGRRSKLGQLHGEWRDVMLLERRSAKVGI
ncbi:GNAT family N-acetyltransferase [Shewanella cyperi]|uniref:GNAT family N-acetyltransferase n=1 Tax=Shewanella cyperi TaxID=2814292 RepID=UPI001A94B2DC|nr:GNAT family N-acetyltransferase [Shewanella cyperi]QSX40187.1 N-acetyltransferase [Shewanella cyperi]